MRETGQRRRNAAVAVALTALGAAGLGVLGAPAMATPVHGPRPFAQAYLKTVGQKSSDVVLAIDEEVGGQSIKVTASGAFDYAHNEGSLKMHVDLGSSGGVQSFQEVLANGRAYVELPAAERAALGVKPWIAVPVVSGGSSSAANESPASVLALLEANSSGLTKLGSASIDGVATTEYRARVDLTKASAKAPPQVRKVLQQVLSWYGGAHSVPLQVWIDGQARVRRVKETFTLNPNVGSMAASTGAVHVVMTVDLSNYGVPVSVTVPPPDQVTRQSLSGLGPAAGGGTFTS